jgi:hypothetical protein
MNMCSLRDPSFLESMAERVSPRLDAISVSR